MGLEVLIFTGKNLLIRKETLIQKNLDFLYLLEKVDITHAGPKNYLGLEFQCLIMQ